MDYSEWLSRRITELRMQKGISARDMSLSLGQSESYINKIENGYVLPSMVGFFNICDFFEITPTQFFDTGANDPKAASELYELGKRLPATQIAHIRQIMEDLIR